MQRRLPALRDVDCVDVALGGQRHRQPDRRRVEDRRQVVGQKVERGAPAVR